jgi:hypothetical protein
MIGDNTIDFVFSFDSLVHAESDVIQAYLGQLTKKLRSNGVGFIHHSNIGEYKQLFAKTKKLPKLLSRSLIKTGILDTSHGRAFTMTARLFESYCQKADLTCVSQEMINWRTSRLIDCFSLFTKKESVWSRPVRTTKNGDFMKEVKRIKQLSKLYSTEYLRNNHKGKAPLF